MKCKFCINLLYHLSRSIFTSSNSFRVKKYTNHIYFPISRSINFSTSNFRIQKSNKRWLFNNLSITLVGVLSFVSAISYGSHKLNNRKEKLFNKFSIFSSTKAESEYYENKELIEVELSSNINESKFQDLSDTTKKSSISNEMEAGSFISGMEIFSTHEISKHNSLDNGVWVTFKEGVYDITAFIESHPGGEEKIMMAKGGAIDPFQSLYGIHNSDKTFQLLEQYRIGNLEPRKSGEKISEDVSDPFRNEPERHPALKVLSENPFNAEAPKDLIADNFFTPNELFYVRNHLPVPLIDPVEYKLSFKGENMQNFQFSLDDLKNKFEKHSVTTTLLCAGNRRNEFTKVKEVRGLKQDTCAISTTTWSGVRLRDFLHYVGLSENNTNLKHICFESLDDPDPTQAFGASIGIDRAIDPKADVLIAYEMNGENIPRDHGYPVRIIVPGVVGARNVKWLGKIIASPEESPSLQQSGPSYRIYGPEVTQENVSTSSAAAIYELPVMSAITTPKNGSQIYEIDETIPIAGYAYSGGGRNIIRVEVSVDGGKTQKTADLCKKPKNVYQHSENVWTWTLQKAELNIPNSHDGKVEITCRARDSAYNVQPEYPSSVYNLRGLLCTSQNRVSVNVEPDDDTDCDE